LLCQAGGDESASRSVRPLESLADLGLGLWEGLLAADLEGRSPTIYKRWKDDPSSVVAPEGEPLERARARVLGDLSKSLERKLERGKPARIAVVVRPWALGIIRATLKGDGAETIGGHAREAPQFEWFTIDGERVRALREPAVPLKTGAA